MEATYAFDTSSPGAASGASQLPHGAHAKNMVFSFTLGDVMFKIEPRRDNTTFEVPAEVLRSSGSVRGSNLIPANSGRGPHQDYLFLKDSTEYTYTTREVVGGGVVEKIMPAGAVVGSQGTMNLYKGATAPEDIDSGAWTERLTRPFRVNASDIASRESGWPSSGTAPSIDVPTKSIVDNGGDGYNHV